MIPWYFIHEVAIFLFLLIIFRKIVVMVLRSRKFWKIAAACCCVGLPWDFSATAIFNMWSFNGSYIFGTAPFGTPLLEETLFCILIPLGISCAWRRKRKEAKQVGGYEYAK